MTNYPTLSLVQSARILRAARPNAPALEILDDAMAGRHDTSPDFVDPDAPEGDWSSPASPFGELLYAAFCNNGLPIPKGPQAEGDPRAWGWIMDTWNAVIMPRFIDRYGLYGKPKGEIARRIQWISACIDMQWKRNKSKNFDIEAAEYLAAELYENPETRPLGPQLAPVHRPTTT